MSDKEKLIIAKRALDKIAHPIKYFQNEAAKKGGTVNGQYAIQLSDNAAWLKDIAATALDLIK